MINNSMSVNNSHTLSVIMVKNNNNKKYVDNSHTLSVYMIKNNNINNTKYVNNSHTLTLKLTLPKLHNGIILFPSCKIARHSPSLSHCKSVTSDDDFMGISSTIPPFLSVT